VDVVYAQDLGIAAYGAIRMNEYYVSQYLDHTPLAHPARGWAVATRQNLGVDGRIPWTVIGSLGRATAATTRSSSTAWPPAQATRRPGSSRRACRARATSTSTRWR
jgi:cellobiose phosphorylase